MIKATIIGPRPTVVELGGIKLLVGEHLTREIQNHVYAGSYEWPELKAIRLALATDDVVMELGAGIGFLSAYCAKVIGSERVFAYEANPELLPYIRDTYRRNGVSPTLEMCLLCEQEGQREFWIREAFWTSSIFASGEARKITVPTKCLHHELERIRPTFVIMDIEGGEAALCRYLAFSSIRTVVLEVHRGQLSSRQVESIKAVLSDAGFQLIRKFSYWKESSVLLLQRHIRQL